MPEQIKALPHPYGSEIVTARDQWEADLLTYALKLDSQKLEVPVSSEDKKLQKIIRQKIENDIPLTMSEQIIPGFMPEQFEFILRNWIEFNPMAEENITMTLKAVEQDKYKIFH